MIQNNQVTVLEIEAVELVAGLFCIHYVFIDNEGCAFGVVGDALADLSVKKSASEVVKRGPVRPR